MFLILDLVTTEGTLFSEEVKEVILPAALGQMGVLPGHLPFLIELKPGAVRIKQQDQPDRFFAVADGIAQIKNERLSIITERAIALEDIDIRSAKEQQAYAERALQSDALKHSNQEEHLELNSLYHFALAQQELKKAYLTHQV